MKPITNFLKSYKELIPVISMIILVFIGFLIVRAQLTKDDEYQKNLILAGGFGITIISWFVVGYINNNNEKKRNRLSIDQSIFQAKRDLKVKFLLDAYFRLENMNFRDYETQADGYIYMKYAESALTAVQLLSTEKTIKLANKFVLSGGSDSFMELLVELRSELRTELALPELPNTVDLTPTHFRIKKDWGEPDKLTSDQQIELIQKLNEFNRQLID